MPIVKIVGPLNETSDHVPTGLIVLAGRSREQENYFFYTQQTAAEGIKKVVVFYSSGLIFLLI
jgi:hypothetical protein